MYTDNENLRLGRELDKAGSGKQWITWQIRQLVV